MTAKISGISELDLPPVSNVGPLRIDWRSEVPKKLRRAQSREAYRLTDQEAEAFWQLRPSEGFAFRFWQEVAYVRGFDYCTIVGDTRDYRSFTALPLRHGRHWCWPSSLAVKKAPPDFIFRANTGQPDQSAPVRSQPTH